MSLWLYKPVLVDADPKYFTKSFFLCGTLWVVLLLFHWLSLNNNNNNKNMAYLKQIWWGDFRSFFFLIIYFFLEKIHYLAVSCKMDNIQRFSWQHHNSFMILGTNYQKPSIKEIYAVHIVSIHLYRTDYRITMSLYIMGRVHGLRKNKLSKQIKGAVPLRLPTSLISSFKTFCFWAPHLLSLRISNELLPHIII